MIARLYKYLFESAKTPTKLGRWCLPSSDFYKNSCNQMQKLEFANYDNCFTTLKNKTNSKNKNTRDPVSIFLQD